MKLTQEQYDALPDNVKALFVKAGDEYIQKPVEPVVPDADNDPAALRRAKDREVQARKDAQAAQKEAEEKLAAYGDDASRKAGDIVAIEKSWKDKLEKQEKDSADALTKANTSIDKYYKDGEALKIATELAMEGKAEVLLPHIKSRLTVDKDGDIPVTRVLGKDGKLSAATLEDLSKEFSDNKAFAGIIKGTKASGGGAGGGNGSGGGGGGAEINSLSDLNKLNGTEEAAWAKDNPEKHQKLRGQPV